MVLKLGFLLMGWMIVTIVTGEVDVDVKPMSDKDMMSGNEGNCYCGVFKDADDPEKAASIIEKKAPETKFSHDDIGEKACQQLCVSMAESAKSKAPVVLCNSINQDHVENLKVKVYSRLCGGKWAYTGKISKSPLCCHKGQPIKCGLGKAIIPLVPPPTS